MSCLLQRAYALLFYYCVYARHVPAKTVLKHVFKQMSELPTISVLTAAIHTGAEAEGIGVDTQ